MHVEWLEKVLNMYANIPDRLFFDHHLQLADFAETYLESLIAQEVALDDQVSVDSFLDFEEPRNSVLLKNITFQRLLFDPTHEPYIFQVCW